MCGSSSLNKHGAWWRVALACLLAALAFAPAARAVCDLQHVMVSAHHGPSCHADAASGSAPGGSGTCCDGNVAAMTQPAALLPDAGVTSALPVLYAAAPAVRGLVPPRALLDVPRGRSPAPYEPVLRRLPRRLT